MIVDSAERRAVGWLKWSDRCSIWSLEIASGTVTKIPFPEAARISFHAGRSGLFSVLEVISVDRFRVTIRDAADPIVSLAHVNLSRDGADFTGDQSLWAFVPTAYYILMSISPSVSNALIVLDAQERIVEWISPMPDSGPDFGEGHSGVVQVPGTDQLLILKHKESETLLYDYVRRKSLNVVRFGNRGGNLEPVFRKNAHEVLAIDYDTLAVLDTSTWTQTRYRQLQAEVDGIRRYVGNLFITRDETRCVVARPFNSDVAILTTDEYEIERTVPVPGSPYDVAMLSSGRVICRDGQTGRFIDWPIIR
jgi:hypothetical protein